MSTTDRAYYMDEWQVGSAFVCTEGDAYWIAEITSTSRQRDTIELRDYFGETSKLSGTVIRDAGSLNVGLSIVRRMVIITTETPDGAFSRSFGREFQRLDAEFRALTDRVQRANEQDPARLGREFDGLVAEMDELHGREYPKGNRVLQQYRELLKASRKSQARPGRVLRSLGLMLLRATYVYESVLGIIERGVRNAEAQSVDASVLKDLRGLQAKAEYLVEGKYGTGQTGTGFMLLQRAGMCQRAFQQEMIRVCSAVALHLLDIAPEGDLGAALDAMQNLSLGRESAAGSGPRLGPSDVALAPDPASVPAAVPTPTALLSHPSPALSPPAPSSSAPAAVTKKAPEGSWEAGRLDMLSRRLSQSEKHAKRLEQASRQQLDQRREDVKKLHEAQTAIDHLEVEVNHLRAALVRESDMHKEEVLLADQQLTHARARLSQAEQERDMALKEVEELRGLLSKTLVFPAPQVAVAGQGLTASSPGAGVKQEPVDAKAATIVSPFGAQTASSASSGHTIASNAAGLPPATQGPPSSAQPGAAGMQSSPVLTHVPLQGAPASQPAASTVQRPPTPPSSSPPQGAPPTRPGSPPVQRPPTPVPSPPQSAPALQSDAPGGPGSQGRVMPQDGWEVIGERPLSTQELSTGGVPMGSGVVLDAGSQDPMQILAAVGLGLTDDYLNSAINDPKLASNLRDAVAFGSLAAQRVFDDVVHGPQSGQLDPTARAEIERLAGQVRNRVNATTKKKAWGFKPTATGGGDTSGLQGYAEAIRAFANAITAFAAGGAHPADGADEPGGPTEGFVTPKARLGRAPSSGDRWGSWSDDGEEPSDGADPLLHPGFGTGDPDLEAILFMIRDGEEVSLRCLGKLHDFMRSNVAWPMPMAIETKISEKYLGDASGYDTAYEQVADRIVHMNRTNYAR